MYKLVIKDLVNLVGEPNQMVWFDPNEWNPSKREERLMDRTVKIIKQIFHKRWPKNFMSFPTKFPFQNRKSLNIPIDLIEKNFLIVMAEIERFKSETEQIEGIAGSINVALTGDGDEKEETRPELKRFEAIELAPDTLEGYSKAKRELYDLTKEFIPEAEYLGFLQTDIPEPSMYEVPEPEEITDELKNLRVPPADRNWLLWGVAMAGIFFLVRGA